MSERYNREYYNRYDVGTGKVDYRTSEELKNFLTQVARRLVEDYHPRTVLDAGCAMGHLVAALRDLGVEAYGIDLSEYAVSQVREDIRPYCAVGSLTDPLPDPLPKRYDLVTCIEVLEHLYEEDAPKAVGRLCACTDLILFSSSPDDFEEPTHLNVRQPEYWARLFAENGFFNKAGCAPDFISLHALCLYRASSLPRVAEDYERELRLLSGALRSAKAGPAPSPCPLSRVFFDAGNGFHSAESGTYELCNGIWDWEIPIPPGTLAVRFDPVEDQACAVKNLEIVSSAGTLSYECLNGFPMDGFWLFITDDPQVLIPLGGNACRWIRIRGSVFAAKDATFLSLLCEISNSTRAQENLRAQKEELLRELESRKAASEEALEQQRLEYEGLLNAKDEAIADAEEAERLLMAELDQYKTNYLAAIGQRDDLQAIYQATVQSTSWRVTRPVRGMLDFFKRAMKSNRVTGLVYRGLGSLRHNGIRGTWKKIQERRYRRNAMKDYVRNNGLSASERKEQQQTLFSQEIRFSVLVPLYNTPDQFLREMIESVQKQTYSHWELCLADGSDSAHPTVRNICEKYAAKDSRIHYKQLDKNLGISENTNACIEMASGDYIGLLDHDDLLHPSALFYAMQAITERGADFIYTDEMTFDTDILHPITMHFKPDFAIDNLRSNNYICHFSCFSRALLDEAGWFRPECDGSQDYDIILRLTEKAKRIVHIPKILYFWRSHAGSVASDISVKPYCITAAKLALNEHLARCGLVGEAVDAPNLTSIYRIEYALLTRPMVSIIIPNKDHAEDLARCVNSIRNTSTYENWEILIVDNQTTDPDTLELYREYADCDNIVVIPWDKPFNYSAINNYAVGEAEGEYLLFLNNDTEVITPGWIEEMLMYAQREDVGAVGVKLYYPDETIQHAGVVVGLRGTAGHVFYKVPKGNLGYMGRLYYAQNYSAVTAACMMVPKEVFQAVGGFDETFVVAYNDVDLCLRIRELGKLIVFTPFAELYHLESVSRGDDQNEENLARFRKEEAQFKSRWKKILEDGDPYFNPNFRLDDPNFAVKPSDVIQ